MTEPTVDEIMEWVKAHAADADTYASCPMCNEYDNDEMHALVAEIERLREDLKREQKAAEGQAAEVKRLNGVCHMHYHDALKANADAEALAEALRWMLEAHDDGDTFSEDARAALAAHEERLKCASTIAQVEGYTGPPVYWRAIRGPAD